MSDNITKPAETTTRDIDRILKLNRMIWARKR
jgi:hypothetical protein